jgi:xanthine dehydrogenase molybdenum-binding subunit
MNKDRIEGIVALEHTLNADKYPLEEYGAVGRRVRRKDGYEKASGYAIYTADIQLPGMLWMRTLTCPYPHAKIKSMDTTKAEALLGVRGVLRYDDPELPERTDTSGHFGEQEPVLNRVGYWQGMPLGVAAAADSEEIANEALKLVEIEWGERPFNIDLEAALKVGAPLTNPESNPDSNLVPPMWHEFKIAHGDVVQGFKEADKTIEFGMRRDTDSWVGPERPCGVFRWNGEYPEVWVKHQRPHLAKRQLAAFFKVPVSQVTVRCPFQGGSFGGWSQMPLNMAPNYIAGILSKRTGKPVKWLFSRREDFCGAGMDNSRFHVKVGFKTDGSITAVAAQAKFSKEGWAHCDHFIENTKIRHVLQESQGAIANILPGHAFRCEQNMNAFCLTATFQHVADALGKDPTELALINDGHEGHAMADLVKEKRAHGFAGDRDSLKECLKAGKKAIEWDTKWHAPGKKKLPNGKMHGIGFAWSHEWGDSGGSGAIAIRIERDDGSARVMGIRCDNGVSAETAYCQIAADELGFRYEHVHYRPFDDAGFVPMTPDSSTNLAVNGWAVRNAARQVKQKILEIATTPRLTERSDMGYAPPFPDCKPEDLDIKDGVVYAKKDTSKRITMAELVRPSFFMGKMDVGATEPLFAYGWQNQQGAYEGPPGARPVFVRQVHFVEVEVDTETGQIEITKVVNANDVGKAINPDAVEGQQYGGSVMGVSRVRTEEMVYCPASGVILNGNLIDYKINTIVDSGPIDTIIVETGMGYGPYGSTGIGEDVATMVPFAFYGAVHNAIGKWVDLPATPDKILKALGKI